MSICVCTRPARADRITAIPCGALRWAACRELKCRDSLIFILSSSSSEDQDDYWNNNGELAGVASRLSYETFSNWRRYTMYYWMKRNPQFLDANWPDFFHIVLHQTFDGVLINLAAYLHHQSLDLIIRCPVADRKEKIQYVLWAPSRTSLGTGLCPEEVDSENDKRAGELRCHICICGRACRNLKEGWSSSLGTGLYSYELADDRDYTMARRSQLWKRQKSGRIQMTPIDLVTLANFILAPVPSALLHPCVTPRHARPHIQIWHLGSPAVLSFTESASSRTLPVLPCHNIPLASQSQVREGDFAKSQTCQEMMIGLCFQS
ncbi:hypothetical protein B0H16DRAFT_1455173 [Mycena metata]|uniref:Uncharacterized protein n=1 Tax=Mycena metata TaxID=1033252 RepID=A0AAD7JIB1_9AGAR|nr:hypothetical protein B0H16DRAFT_1455173 [Mycena metata]